MKTYPNIYEARTAGLASLADIGKMFRLTRQSIHKASKRPGFPAPVARYVIGGDREGMLWSRREVTDWRRARSQKIAA